MENKDELEQLSEMIKQPIKNIKHRNNLTIIEFIDGQELTLQGNLVELNCKVPVCNFCGLPSFNYPLFSADKKNFICKDCTELVVETFFKKGIEMKLKLPFGGEQVAQVLKNLNQITPENNE